MSGELKPCGHHPDSGCTCRPPDGRLGGIGAPPGWAETRAQLLADAATAEEVARAVLTERVRAAIDALVFSRPGWYVDGDTGEMSAAAVGVFVEWLRNPPERVVQFDGSAAPRCEATTRDGNRCGYPAGHSEGHAALNAAGAPCIEWG